MKKLYFAAAACAMAFFAGCSSYSEIAYWKSGVRVNSGEKPLASFLTQNFSYQLFHCIPIATGVPWTEGDEDVMDDYNVEWFADKATVDNNIVSLRYALRKVGSNRVEDLVSSYDDSSMWSLFLVNRREVRTSCLIMPPEPPAEKK